MMVRAASSLCLLRDTTFYSSHNLVVSCFSDFTLKEFSHESLQLCNDFMCFHFSFKMGGSALLLCLR